MKSVANRAAGISLITGLLFSPMLLAETLEGLDEVNALNLEETDVLGLGEAISGSELAGLSGREGLSYTYKLQLSELSEKATVSNNAVYSSITGLNSVSNGAFSGANGISTLIQNSGNNVVIQDATILQVTVNP